MWKQLLVGSALLVGIAVGGYALFSRSGAQPHSSGDKTISAAAGARNWLQEHGYLDENGRPVPPPQPVSGQP
jgi:hypothetical protein